jgi:signal transduction histidine kinase/transcriptional regulator with GAF, ATPase, and Fis domain
MKYNKVNLPDLHFMAETSPYSSEEINPRLLEALASLNQISTAINRIGSSESPNQAESLQLIVESATRVVSGSSASIFNYNPTQNCLDSNSRVSSIKNEKSFDISLDTPRTNGYGMRAIEKKYRTLSYEEIDLQIHPYQIQQSVKAVACYPLMVAKETLGVLYISLYEERKLSQLEELLLDNFVNQAAMAIYQMRHLSGMKRNLAQKENELNQLRHAGMLISSRLKLEETLQSILDLALELTHAQYGIFRLLDKQGEHLVTRAVSSTHLEKPLVEKLPFHGKSIMAHVARTRQPLLIHDLREKQWADMYYPLDSQIEMRAELCVPLINASGRLEGVLNLESPRVNGFSEDDSHILQSLATYAVTAIQEVKLLDALQEAAQLIISQPSQVVLEQLCLMSNDLLNASSSAVWLKNEQGEFILTSANGVVKHIEKLPKHKSDSPVKIALEFQEKLKNATSQAVMMPLISGENAKVLGMFGVFHPDTSQERSVLSEWDKKVLACLSNYAVLAIQNQSNQQALRKSQEQHLIAETFAAVGDISANVLHNMNNKVGIIPARVQALQDKYQDVLETDLYLKNSLHEIERGATAAMKIVQENLSHLRPIQLEQMQIAPIVSTVIRDIQIPAQVNIEIKSLDNLPMIIANRQSLVFVFRNLIENAMDAMQNKGEIKISGSLYNQWVEINISDNGTGILPELHEQIFELEHSSRIHAGKMGFGLWWVKTLMSRLGGSVQIESDGKNGATFILRLPIAESESK